MAMAQVSKEQEHADLLWKWVWVSGIHHSDLGQRDVGEAQQQHESWDDRGQ